MKCIKSFFTHLICIEHLFSARVCFVSFRFFGIMEDEDSMRHADVMEGGDSERGPGQAILRGWPLSKNVVV